MISNKTIGIHLKIIENTLIEVKERLKIIEEESIDTDFVEFLKEDSMSKLGIIKRHIDNVVGKLERGKGMKYKCVKSNKNYDLTLDKEYEGFKYKDGWILIRPDDRGDSVLCREEHLEVVK